MKLLFLMLLISSLTLAWFASQQPAPEDPRRVAVNLPRVHDLQLIGEDPKSGESEPEDLPEARLQLAQKSSSGSANRDTGPQDDAASMDMGRPLLLGLPHLPAGGASLSVPLPEAVQGPERCLVASGFESEEAATQWLDKLKGDYQLTGETRSQSVPREPLHWVLVPPLENRQEGLKLLRALQGRGIDSYLITQGDNKNAISLGLFKSLRAARSVLRQRQEAGIDAVLTVFARSQELHSVVVAANDLEAISGAVTENIATKIETEACRVLHS